MLLNLTVHFSILIVLCGNQSNLKPACWIIYVFCKAIFKWKLCNSVRFHIFKAATTSAFFSFPRKCQPKFFNIKWYIRSDCSYELLRLYLVFIILHKNRPYKLPFFRFMLGFVNNHLLHFIKTDKGPENLQKWKSYIIIFVYSKFQQNHRVLRVWFFFQYEWSPKAMIMTFLTIWYPLPLRYEFLYIMLMGNLIIDQIVLFQFSKLISICTYYDFF